MLGSEGNWKGVIGFVLGHRRYGYIGRVREVGFWTSVNRAKELCYFADTIGAIVEKEESIVV